ncbi:MAG: FemAB family PEP-CTERM system-associated protein [Gammaproteobacteria bacterium]|nr:MAG: FemAB family PEP-CTERM system-associated protein [Gammaproteobacteria bacterium]
MQIRAFERNRDRAAWDAYVEAHPGGSFFHLSGWETILADFFHHRTHYLLAEAGGRLQGLIPLAEVRSRLFGNRLVSVPLGVYGGALADDEAVETALRDAAIELAEQRRVDHLELRHLQPRPGLPTVDRYVRFRRAIHADADANMAEIPRKQRAMIRKAMRKGLQAGFGRDTGVFYRLYAESLRNLGTPVLPRAYFEQLHAVFGAACEQLTVRDAGGRPVASVLSFYFRDEVLPYYGGGSAAARALSANDFMYWELMCHAAARGVRRFDFGRSRVGAGSYHFKRHWGFEPEPLHYQYHLRQGQALPNASPDNPRFQLAIRCWQRLPLRLTTWLGPLVARQLTW